jgi:hypothetical protein
VLHQIWRPAVPMRRMATREVFGPVVSSLRLGHECAAAPALRARTLAAMTTAATASWSSPLQQSCLEPAAAVCNPSSRSPETHQLCCRDRSDATSSNEKDTLLASLGHLRDREQSHKVMHKPPVRSPCDRDDFAERIHRGECPRVRWDSAPVFVSQTSKDAMLQPAGRFCYPAADQQQGRCQSTTSEREYGPHAAAVGSPRRRPVAERSTSVHSPFPRGEPSGVA